VFEETKFHLKGINDSLVSTIGRTYLDVKLGENIVVTDFQVVHSDFPIPHDGILRRPFLASNQIIINYETNKVTIPDKSDIVLKPRTETLVRVAAEDSLEGKEVVITNQELADSIICSNVVTRIHNNDALVLLINPTEQAVRLQVPSLENLEYEPYHEALVRTVQSQLESEPQIDGNRISLLNEALRTTHLNSEEKASLKEVLPRIL